MAHRRRFLRSSLVPLSAAFVLASTVISGIASAANPGSGTITPTVSKAWDGENYTRLVPDQNACPPQSADPGNAICDHYILTVMVPANYYASQAGGAEVTVTWADRADDFDLFIYKGSTLVASSALGGTNSEMATIDRASGSYEVRVSPFLVTNSAYKGTAKLVTRPNTAPPLGGPAKFHGTRITGALPSTEPKNVPTTDNPGLAPLTLKFYNTGRKAAEPTIGVDRRSHVDPTTGQTIKGNAYFAAATFDGVGGLADTRIRRSRSEGRTWEDKTPARDLPVTLDPYVYVEEDSGRLFDLDLYVANSFLQYSDDGGETYTTSICGSSCTDAVNDHQTLFAGPRPAGAPATVLPPSDPKFPELLYYCFNRVVDSDCTRSSDGGQTFVKTGAPAYTGVNGNGQFCGGLHGHVVTDKLGNVFLPRGYCDDPFVSISKDAGTTWTRVKVSNTVSMPDNQSSMAADGANNLYYVWYDGTYKLPFLATSTDHGLTWSKPLMIAPPNVREVAGFGPTIAAGANGKIAISFPGTTQTNQGDLTRPWDYYVLTSLDALSTNPTFVSNIANPATDPVHRGDCPGRCGNMLDFLDIVISPAPGHAIWATVVDTCTSQACRTPGAKGFDEANGTDNTASDMQGMVARQVTGLPDLGPPGTCRTCQ